MVYEYTKPRTEIAASFRGPGPCAYKLPGLTGYVKMDPLSNHPKGPAFPFGVKHGKFSDDASPGPVYNPDKEITRHGKDGTPKCSLHDRTKDMAVFPVPGPGAYSPEHAGPSAHPQSPRYTFGSRTRQKSTDKNPSPNSYSLPTLLGSTVEGGRRQPPMYSLKGRRTTGSFCEDLAKTPGPGTYGSSDPNLVQTRRPLYSMLGRNTMPGDNTRKPGPGAHSPERVVATKKKAPDYSFGIRHSDYTTPLIIAVSD